MGWLERWDRRNQRILEYHNALERESRPRWNRRQFVLLVAAWLVMRVVAEAAFDRWGAWAMTAVGVVIVAVLVVGGLAAHRKRLAWEASRKGCLDEWPAT